LKKINSLLISAFLVVISTQSIAGVKEKKAIRALNATVQTQTEAAKVACGNAALTSEVEVDAKFTPHNIKIADSNAKDFFEGLIDACKDADYKEEISKITQLQVSLSDATKKTGTSTKIHGELTLEGTSLLVKVHVKYSFSNGSSSTASNAVKGLF